VEELLCIPTKDEEDGTSDDAATTMQQPAPRTTKTRNLALMCHSEYDLISFNKLTSRRAYEVMALMANGGDFKQLELLKNEEMELTLSTILPLLICDSVERRPALFFKGLTSFQPLYNLRLRGFRTKEATGCTYKVVDPYTCGHWGVHETLLFFFIGDPQLIRQLLHCK